MLSHVDQLLISALATVDCLFWPDRLPRRPGGGYVVGCERRWNYRTAGTPWSGVVKAGTNAATWKANQRDREAIEAEGFVEVRRSAGRSVGIVLTDAGDARGRALCGLPSLGDALPLLSRLAELAESPNGCDHLGHAWTCEWELFGLGEDYGGCKKFSEISTLTERMLPLLHRGLAVVNCSSQGHAWYRLTDVAPEPFEPIANLPDECEPAWRAYYAAFDEVTREMETATPESTSEIGAIPMPVGSCRGAREAQRKRRSRKR